MKKLLRFLLVLIIGCILGYVFHNPIDDKLKAKFGNDRVEAGKARVEKFGEKTVDVANAAVDAVKNELDSAKTE